MSKNDGGAAFPKTVSSTFPKQDGMSLRDYFAAKAMQGMCTITNKWTFPASTIPSIAYEMADNMLKEREK